MSITRKEFFKQSLFSLGKSALDLADTLKVRFPSLPVLQGEATSPKPRPEMMAEAFNERCLSGSDACTSCIDRCAPKAIKPLPGGGVQINQLFCTGCSECEYVCPVEPKAIVLVPR